MTGEPLNRRAFFRKGLRDVAHTLVEAKEAIANRTRPTASVNEQSPLFRLRPPGAVEETKFLERCISCDLCFDACPVECIQRVPEGMRDAGTPFIDASERACAVCTDLNCTKVCPEDALQPLESWREIQMGIAEVREFACIAFLGTTCRACHDICPTLPRAITLQNSRPQVIPDLCIGCGLCEQACPTQPKAIVVRDHSRDQWHARQDAEEK